MNVSLKYKLCLIAGIMGIAVISGIMESLATPRTGMKEETQKAKPPADAV
jgi:hypothetical protein